jgi:hypothetical protein
LGKFFVCEWQSASPADFVKYWATFYNDPREQLYLAHIDKPLTPPGVLDLFIWKNGGPLAEQKRQSVVRNYVDRLDETRKLPIDTTGRDFLSRFAVGGAIWRIFWLHCRWPERFPIYDQHVHRAFAFIQEGRLEEIAARNDEEKVRLYLEHYLPFYQQFRGVNHRETNRALWVFGKFIKTWPRPSVPALLNKPNVQ